MVRGQVSVEYLVIVGLALGLLIPAVFFFFTFNKSAGGDAVSATVNAAGIEMLSAVKATYSLGRNARQTVEIVMPPEVTEVYITGINGNLGYEIVFEYDTSNGLSQAVFFSDIGMNTTGADSSESEWPVSNAHPGNTKYLFESLGTSVVITEPGVGP